jgi:hypothetical protein
MATAASSSPAAAAAAAGAVEQQLSTSRARRLVIYNLIAGQHLVNYLCRLSIPFVVPFICAEGGYTDVQRAMLLNAFTPGYVLTQVPAAAMINKIGAKAVLTINNLGMLVALALLPTAARTGATAVAACFTALGIVQGPYVTATTWMTKHWVPVGPERPLGIMIIRNGSNISKVLAAALTPGLCGRFGWRAAPYFYGSVVGAYVVAWAGLSASQPPPLELRPTAGSTEAASKTTAVVAAAPKFNIRELVQLLHTRPFKALFLCQLAHNLGEFHIFGPWVPTYYNQASQHATRKVFWCTDAQELISLTLSCMQVLGVPMEAVGSYIKWPVISAIGIKLIVGIWESKLLSLGWSQKFLRKAAVWTASTLNWGGILLFASARTPAFATVGQVLIFAGSSFDSQAGFLPNTIEVCDKDIGYLGSCLNTASWLFSFLLAMPLASFKMKFGWRYLWAFPAVLRVITTLYFSRHAQIEPARSFLNRPQVSGEKKS